VIVYEALSWRVAGIPQLRHNERLFRLRAVQAVIPI
jgi:hypothetical protein